MHRRGNDQPNRAGREQHKDDESGNHSLVHDLSLDRSAEVRFRATAQSAGGILRREGTSSSENPYTRGVGKRTVTVLLITVLALIVATAFPKQVEKLSGHREAGNVLMFIFLASVGAGADIWKLIENAPVLFLFASVIITVHLVILFGIGKILKLDLAELAMASAVLVGGPASAPALASAKGWRDLLIPGLLLGSLGYAVGSFIGVSVVEWLR